MVSTARSAADGADVEVIPPARGRGGELVGDGLQGPRTALSGSASTVGVPAAPTRAAGLKRDLAEQRHRRAQDPVSESATAEPPPAPKTSTREPSGSSIQDMFSTRRPAAGGSAARSSRPLGHLGRGHLRRRQRPAAPRSGSAVRWRCDVTVPGGRSSTARPDRPRTTSARNCCSARCNIGPRKTTARYPGEHADRDALHPCACGGMIMSSTLVGRAVVPSIRGPSAVDVGVADTDRQPAGLHSRGQVHTDRRLPTPPFRTMQ